LNLKETDSWGNLEEDAIATYWNTREEELAIKRGLGK
jgi:hypothetical protein